MDPVKLILDNHNLVRVRNATSKQTAHRSDTSGGEDTNEELGDDELEDRGESGDFSSSPSATRVSV